MANERHCLCLTKNCMKKAWAWCSSWCRRLILLCVVGFFIFMYISPNVFNSFKEDKTRQSELTRQCIDEHLGLFRNDIDEGNADVRRSQPDPNVEDKSFLPFIGNGFLGLTVTQASSVYFRKARTLSLNLNWSPIVSISEPWSPVMDEAVVTHFTTGRIYRFQCFSRGLHSSYEYYVHREKPNLFIQEIKISNPSNKKMPVYLSNPAHTLWPSATSRIIRLFEGSSEKSQYRVISGLLPEGSTANNDMAIHVVLKVTSQSYELEPHSSTIIHVPCTICVDQIRKGDYHNQKNDLEMKCIKLQKSFLALNINQLKNEHINAWKSHWDSGFHISQSKAVDALNGEKINATIYYVLSNTPQNGTLPMVHYSTTYNHSYFYLAEGCYGSYPTLQAVNIWKPLRNIKEVSESVSLWLLTLEKQGCHKLISAGAVGVMQAMILSFGGFRFNSHHLEFKSDPKVLHRNYGFRRIHYGDKTYINVTITLQTDNKALLGVSLDKHDKDYYACDAGCSEQPVKLESSSSFLPVKVTEPLTSILYITSDKKHMELIKDTLHVHKIVEAPAGDHHAIALHKHGHHLGGLPVLFWASICFLIIVFHLFLFKLIVNEYCDKQDKYRVRYGKI